MSVSLGLFKVFWNVFLFFLFFSKPDIDVLGYQCPVVIAISECSIKNILTTRVNGLPGSPDITLQLFKSHFYPKRLTVD